MKPEEIKKMLDAQDAAIRQGWAESAQLRVGSGAEKAKVDKAIAAGEKLKGLAKAETD
jgi:hypothetical protein